MLDSCDLVTNELYNGLGENMLRVVGSNRPELLDDNLS